MIKRYIGAREANQQFSAIIKAVEEDGVTVVITRRGEPVVQIQRADPVRSADEVAARMDALFEKYGRPMNYRRGIDRASIHDRDVKSDRE